MEHDEIARALAGIVALAPAHIGAVALWPAYSGSDNFLGCLLDTKMCIIPGTTCWKPTNNLFTVLDELEKSAQLVQRAHEADQQNRTIARATIETQAFDGLNAGERM